MLCEQEEQNIPSPVFLDGQLERITGASEHLPLQVEIDSVLASTYTHAPTIAYHIKNATLVDGSVYIGSYKHFVAEKHLFGPPAVTVESVASTALASSAVGTRYFGHWVLDDCLRYMLAERLGKPLCIRTPDWPHKAGYAKYFDQDWTAVDRVFVENLIVYQDHGQNSLKRQRYQQLRSKVQKIVGEVQASRSVVYLRRGATGVARIVDSEDELLRELHIAGVSVVDVDDGLDAVLAGLAQAKIIISMEGSHVVHCFFGLDSTRGLIVLQPADRFAALHRHWAACIGVHFGFVVGERTAGGYSFVAADILRTVDAMLLRIHGSQA